MNRLTLSLLRQLLGRWGLLWMGLGWILLWRLHFDPHLGRAHLGSYLASVALGPSLLLLRLAVMLDRRRREGWPLEECLRDPQHWRLPTAEVQATFLLMALWWLGAALGTHLPGLARPEAGMDLYPVQLSAAANGQWHVDLLGPCPPGGQLVLTLDWEQAPIELRRAGRVEWQGEAGQDITLTAGELARWPLSPGDCRRGQAILPPLPEGIQVLRPLARLELPRPGADALPALLLGQALFFLPLLGILQLFFRGGHLSGSLSAWATLALAGLVALPDPTFQPPSDPLGYLARALLAFKALLPPVSSLLASGDDFSRQLGASSTLAVGAWLLLGLIAFCFAWWRRPPFRP